MSKNLYDILEIDKKADPAAVKAAYRKKAKAAHPDKNNGKDTGEMAALTLAYDILSNKDKREYYDKTGQTKSLEFEQLFAGFMQTIVLPVLLQYPDLTSTHMINKIKEACKDQLTGGEKEINKIRKEIDKIDVFIARLRPNAETVNRMATFLDMQKSGMEQQIQAHNHNIQNINKCLNHVCEYGYEVEEREPATADYATAFSANIFESFTPNRRRRGSSW